MSSPIAVGYATLCTAPHWPCSANADIFINCLPICLHASGRIGVHRGGGRLLRGSGRRTMRECDSNSVQQLCRRMGYTVGRQCSISVGDPFCVQTVRMFLNECRLFSRVERCVWMSYLSVCWRGQAPRESRNNQFANANKSFPPNSHITSQKRRQRAVKPIYCRTEREKLPNGIFHLGYPSLADAEHAKYVCVVARIVKHAVGDAFACHGCCLECMIGSFYGVFSHRLVYGGVTSSICVDCVWIMIKLIEGLIQLPVANVVNGNAGQYESGFEYSRTGKKYEVSKDFSSGRSIWKCGNSTNNATFLLRTMICNVGWNLAYSRIL